MKPLGCDAARPKAPAVSPQVLSMVAVEEDVAVGVEVLRNWGAVVAFMAGAVVFQ